MEAEVFEEGVAGEGEAVKPRPMFNSHIKRSPQTDKKLETIVSTAYRPHDSRDRNRVTALTNQTD